MNIRELSRAISRSDIQKGNMERAKEHYSDSIKKDDDNIRSTSTRKITKEKPLVEQYKGTKVNTSA
jgi:hypothetical protein